MAHPTVNIIRLKHYLVLHSFLIVGGCLLTGALQERIVIYPSKHGPLWCIFLMGCLIYTIFHLDIESENGAQQLIAMLIVKLAIKCPDNFKELSKNLK